MKRITIAAVLCFAAALQTAYSQQKQEQTQLRALPAAFCRIDATNKTFRVVPWDKESHNFLRNSQKVLRWDDGTQLVSGATTLTMMQFIGGKSLGADIKGIADLQGVRGQFHIKTTGGKDVVQKVVMIEVFAGEQMATWPPHKVFCGDETK